ncbi:MAG: glycerol-3-phosphate 1-O-acyltransferase PlsY [Chloroflexota bacterium]|nr:MAG: glycerol-3-phosphate 1-O-acyltransferase PlsY [Chloroflexota bacterium]TMD86820.1 MAG: glycerol-3-phosphate 1-O-acyltransferase PlsY [Chloroflexota bacterium]
MVNVLLLVAFGYLLGSVPSGWLVMKVYRNQDLRKLGSGNIGAANVFRAGGPGAFALTLIADGLKGFIPVMLGIAFGLGGNELALAAVGLAAVVGHNWPLYLGFRGGKGVATSGGVLLALAPVAIVLAALAWFLVIRITRVASVASLSAVAVGFISLIVLHLVGWQAWRPVGWSVVVLGVILAALILFRHRINIERLATGRELKITAH